LFNLCDITSKLILSLGHILSDVSYQSLSRSWLRVVPSIERGNMAHGGCDRSTGDVYSSMAPDPTSNIFGGPCTPILWFVFPFRLTRLITDRYICHFIIMHLEQGCASCEIW
jgi:hypothetical protein